LGHNDLARSVGRLSAASPSPIVRDPLHHVDPYYGLAQSAQFGHTVFQVIELQLFKEPVGIGNPFRFRTDWSSAGSSLGGAVADLVDHHS